MRFLLLSLILLNTQFVFAQDVLLHSSWQFKQVGTTTWHRAQVPGTVHTDLLLNHLIPDPFYRDNETKVQWVEKEDWEYKTDFSCLFNRNELMPIYLEFDGLDTYAEVFLNGNSILKSDNMFRTYKIDVTAYLKNSKNQLRILFRSAVNQTDSLAKKSLLLHPCENNRHYARKAQYHFGWDFAPRLITCGIWRPIHLIYGDEKNPAPPQYSNVKLVQQKDSIGQSFYFTNGAKAVFMKGANWVPADVFLPRISHAKYRDLLMKAKEAHFNLLRVWGGGIYEDDYFYDLCDSLGISVWQDFMFAGAMYPADSASLENIKQEAIDNILRLRKHKCLVVWCGNNEIDEAWHNWGWQNQFHISQNDSMVLWTEYKKIFQELLPSLVKEYDPQRAYISTTPMYGWGRAQSMTMGDSHYWGMWWGMDSISIMKKKIPRFMSEYGMQAMPSMASLLKFLKPEDLDTSGKMMHCHQKHPTGFQTLHKYLMMEKIPAHDFNSFCMATQELQSRALETAITAQQHSHGRCMGTLLWQYNDCWPGCTWSIVDYYGCKKKGYQTVKKLYNNKYQ
jgi:beta-mannosidase